VAGLACFSVTIDLLFLSLLKIRSRVNTGRIPQGMKEMFFLTVLRAMVNKKDQ